ncbi:MAG: hypothetical protein H0U92_02410 [Actinobacteria bacterium]|nr:hypothetical protein [Actinomycetota bacterium]
MDLVELVIGVHTTLDAHGLPHAFGGALALTYVAQPRTTIDIDVNVFAPLADLKRVSTALATLDFVPEANDHLPIAGVRFRHPVTPFPVDVFLSLSDEYVLIEQRVTTHPFGRADDVLPFLSAEDLCIFKLSFARPKDWIDLAAVVDARPSLDVAYIEEQLVALRGPTMYPRVARLRSLISRA